MLDLRNVRCMPCAVTAFLAELKTSDAEPPAPWGAAVAR